jgi:hypothetical protein
MAMAGVPTTKLRPEIAHVLFIDIVGYSKLLITEQSEQLQKLKEMVRSTEQFRLVTRLEAEERGESGRSTQIIFVSSISLSPRQRVMDFTKKLNAQKTEEEAGGVASINTLRGRWLIVEG